MQAQPCHRRSDHRSRGNYTCIADEPCPTDEDLDTIFSRFGPIVSCEVIRDKRTKDSLQYAFIEFENQKDCEQAYFKMQGVLIDDHRIHVDFSQSVCRRQVSSSYPSLTETTGFSAFRQMANRYEL